MSVLNKKFQIISHPKTPVVSLVVSSWLFIALFSLSLKWRSRIMRRGKYILFVLGKGATILPLQRLLFVPKMCEYGKIFNKQILYQICMIFFCFTPCMFKYSSCRIPRVRWGLSCSWIVLSPAWPSALTVTSRPALYQWVVCEVARAAWEACRQNEHQVVLVSWKGVQKREGTLRTEVINWKR